MIIILGFPVIFSIVFFVMTIFTVFKTKKDSKEIFSLIERNANKDYVSKFLEERKSFINKKARITAEAYIYGNI